MENAPMRILLADDDETDRQLFIEAFEEIKIRTHVHTLNDGLHLMNYLVAEDAHLPDLIFLDLNMPRKGGLECLKEIRMNEKFDAVPIAIYSTSAAERDINDTFTNGANVYIQKPNDFDTLKEVLSRAIMATYQYQRPPFRMENFLLKI